MNATRTMSDELDLWLEVQKAKYVTGRSMPMGDLPDPVPKGEPVPPCPLTDAEIDWLWPLYQCCSFPPATFAKRFAGTARDKLTPRGKNAAVTLAYRYRRQIFGAVAVKWDPARFLDAVRRAAATVGDIKR